MRTRRALSRPWIVVCFIVAILCVAFGGRIFEPQGWQRMQRQPILVPDAAWERGAVQEPIVWHDGFEFQMIYSAGWEACAIGTASSHDGIQWVKNPNNPILGQGRGGVDIACRPSFVRHGARHLLFFANGIGEKADSIFMAESHDGAIYKVRSQPVLAPSQWAINLANTHVWHDGARWTMLVDGMNKNRIWETGIAHATTLDSFQLEAQPLKSLSIGGAYGAPWVTQENGIYHLRYLAASNGNLPTDIWHAKSTDGRTWVRDAQPELRHTKNKWEFDQVADPAIVEHGGETFMYYAGMDNRKIYAGYIHVARKIKAVP